MGYPWTLERQAVDASSRIPDMDVHYHLWRRSGRVFTMGSKRYQTADAAQKVAVRAGLAVDQRMVRKCSDCPPSVRSKRREQTAAAIARKMAAVLELDPATVRVAYDAALKGQTL